MTARPTGTVTFLFTDIEGSTRLWETHPEAMRAALAAHDEILRDAISANDGYVFSTAGDAFAAAFSGPHQAIDAAVTAQHALAGREWPEPVAVRVRMGIHSGEADERDGDYFGPTLNRGARIMSAGHGGQVLVSAATASLLIDGDDGHLTRPTLRDLGEHRLKDLATPERLHQLDVTGLTTEFPPLRTIERAVGNLPQQVTSFVGRATELARLDDELANARALTLTGPGGVGKTRLAVQAATAAAERFSDGAWLVELAPVTDPEAVWLAIANTLSVQQRSGMSVVESVLDHLRPKRLLLVIDNAEHVVDEVADVVESVLRDCPQVVLLVTTREALSVAGEVICPVRPLGADAVTLFRDRARAADVLLADDDATAAAIAQICERLDGLPLAVELAAAQTRTFSPATIAERLDERFRILTGARRGAVERHQTLRATVDWSYSHLEPDQQNLFNRLSVFAGGFTLDAAEGVCGGGDLDPRDVPTLLAALVDKSMVTVEHTPRGTRYGLLETLRSFGAEQLAASGDAIERGLAHGRWFAEWMSGGERGLLSPLQGEWMASIAEEEGNLRLAVTRLLEAGEIEAAGRIPAHLTYYAMFVGSMEATIWAEMVVEAAPDTAPLSCVATAALGIGLRGELQRAHELIVAAAARAEPRTADEGFLASAMGIVCLFLGDLDTAIERLGYAVEVAQEIGDDWLALRSYTPFVIATAYTGDVDGALGMMDELRRLAEHNGAPSAMGFYNYTHGEVLGLIDGPAALPYLTKAIEWAKLTGERYTMSIALLTWSSLQGRHGQPVAALHSFEEALAYAFDAGNRPQFWTCIRNLVELFCRIDRCHAAAVLFGAQEAAEGTSAIFGVGAEQLARARERFGTTLSPEDLEACLGRGMTLDVDAACELATHEIHAALAVLEAAAA